MAVPTLFLSLHHLNSIQKNCNYILRKKSYDNTSHPANVNLYRLMFQKPTIVHIGISNPPSSTKNKSTPTYSMSCDEKYEGYSTYNRNQTLQQQFDINNLNLPMISLLIFIEK